MADTESFSEDITALWGAPSESVLDPPRPNGTATNDTASPNGRAPELAPASINGSQVEVPTEDPGQKVARLADALAGHQVDVVRRSELQGLQAKLEDSFTQQLAVVLYELLSASNDRFASVEDHMDQRLENIAARLDQSIASQGDRLTAVIDAQQRATADLARLVHDQLAEISDRFSGPVEALTPFQREMRHEVSRLGDVVAAHGLQADRRSEVEAERAAEAGAALSERVEGSERRDVVATQQLEHITERISSVQSDLSTLHEAIKELRDEVTILRRRTGRVRGRWGRSTDRRDESTSMNEATSE